MSSTESEQDVCLEHLALLIYEKNEVNRRRRRALASFHRTGKYEFLTLYENLKMERRAMTTVISRMRKKLSVELLWDTGGYCIRICVVKKVKHKNGLSDRTVLKRIELPEINSMAINYATESLLK